MNLPASLVYLMCLATSVTCAALLVRAYRREGARLLLWTGAGFAALAFNNLFLVLDLMIFPGLDLRVLRQIATGSAIVILLYGFVWEMKR